MKKGQQLIAVICVIILLLVIAWVCIRDTDTATFNTYTIGCVRAPSPYDSSAFLIYTVNGDSAEKIPEIHIVRLGEKERTIFVYRDKSYDSSVIFPNGTVMLFYREPGRTLFKLSSTYKKYLSNGTISDELRKEFIKNNIQLPSNATVTYRDSWWYVTVNGKDRYIILDATEYEGILWVCRKPDNLVKAAEIDPHGNLIFEGREVPNPTNAEVRLFYARFITHDNLIGGIAYTRTYESDPWYERNRSYAELDTNLNLVKEWPIPFSDFDIRQIVYDNNTLHFLLVNTYTPTYKDFFYAKTNRNGTVLVPPTPLSNVSVVPGFPVVEGSDGELLYLGDDGCGFGDDVFVVGGWGLWIEVDEYGNQYMPGDEYPGRVMFRRFGSNGVEEINKTLTLFDNLPDPYIYDFHVVADTEGNIHTVFILNDGENHISIQYIKFDKNGNILVGPIQIAPNGKEETISWLLWITLATILVATPTTAYIVYKKKRNTQENNSI